MSEVKLERVNPYLPYLDPDDPGTTRHPLEIEEEAAVQATADWIKAEIDKEILAIIMAERVRHG